jgi:DNA polymerase III delta prime subunit
VNPAQAERSAERDRQRAEGERVTELLREIPAVDYFARLADRHVKDGDKTECPVHEERTPSCHVGGPNPTKWLCFGCNAGGDIFDLYVALHGGSLSGKGFVEARDELAELFGIRSDSPPPPPRAVTKRKPPEPLPSAEEVDEWHATLRHNPDFDGIRKRFAWTPEGVDRLRIGWHARWQRFTFPSFEADGELVNVSFYSPKPDEKAKGRYRYKAFALAGRERPMFPMPDTVESDWLIVCEGEKDALALTSAGLPASGIPGLAYVANLKAEAVAAELARFERVAVMFDCDENTEPEGEPPKPKGREAATRLAAALAAAGVDARLLDLAPGRTDGFDATDWLLGLYEDGATPENVRGLVERWIDDTPSYRPVETPTTPGEPSANGSPELNGSIPSPRVDEAVTQPPPSNPAPHDLASEAAALGAALQSPGAFDALLAEGVTAADFGTEAHVAVFDAMTAVYTAHTGDGSVPIDTVTIAAALRDAGKLAQAGGDEALADLIARCPQPDHVRQYAATIREHTTRRHLFAFGVELQQGARGGVDLAQLASRAVDVLSATETSTASAVVTTAAFLARPFELTTPYVTAREGKTHLLAAETGLLLAGPSGTGKSLAAIQLAALLASDDGGDWLGCAVRGGLRVLLVSLEGSEADTRDRLNNIVPDDARKRLVLVDRWRRPLGDLAPQIREHSIDVVVFDTLSAWLQGFGLDLKTGIPEEAHAYLEDLQRRSGQRFAWGGTHHTRKLDTKGKVSDALEEIAGTIHKKADAAVIIRRDGDDKARRKIAFAKTRKGREPEDVIATLPEEDDEAPVFRVLAEIDAAHLKEGTRPAEIADWIAEQEQPQAPRQILTRFKISEGTLRERRGELLALGIRYGTKPGGGNRTLYGTDRQWVTTYDAVPEEGAA